MTLKEMLEAGMINQEAYDLLNQTEPQPLPHPQPPTEPVDHFLEYVKQCNV